MAGHRRGDHVFNLGLRKTLEDMGRSVQSELGAHGGDTRLWARATDLRMRVEALAATLKHPAFELAVDKPPAPGPDLNSRQFGASNEQAVFAFRQFLTAIRQYYTVAVDDAWSTNYLGMLSTACLQAELAIGHWIDEAYDGEAANQAIDEDRGAAQLIEVGKARVGEVRRGLIELVCRESPGRSAMHGVSRRLFE